MNNLTGAGEPKVAAPLLTTSGPVVSDAKRASVLNKHFAAVSKAAKKTNTSIALDKVRKAATVNGFTETHTFSQPFTCEEVAFAVRKSRLRKAPGPDRISNEMLRNLGSGGFSALRDLLNRTWIKGEYPSAWRGATIVPILKKGKAADKADSYRPISLTSNVGKVAERIINRRLMWYLEDKKLIAPQQGGFREKRNAIDQVTVFMQKGVTNRPG